MARSESTNISRAYRNDVATMGFMSQRADAGGPGNRERSALAGKRFLVVDDQSYMIDVVGEMLRHHGAADVVRAESVEIAAARLGPGAVCDSIICDFNMKPVNGIQFLQAIRAGRLAHAKRDQSFILLTGHGDMEVVKAAKALDVSGYAVKPVAPDTFLKVVTRALSSALTLKNAEVYAQVPTQDLRRLQ